MVEWGEFEYDGHSLLFNGHARMPPDLLPSFLLTADGDDRPHAWWIAQTKLYDLKTSDKPSIREIRELLAQAIRQNRLVVPDVLREAERNADAFLRLANARDAFARRHLPPPTPRTSPPPAKSRGPATPSRPSSPSPRQSQASPGAMPLQGMLAHPTLMSLPLAAPVPVPGPTPHAIPLFTMMSQGGIPVPAPGPNPPPLVPAYARYAAYTTVAPPRATPAAHTPAHTAANSPTPQHGKPDMDDDDDERHSSPAVAAEIDELAEEDAATRPTSKNGPSTSAPQDVPPDRPKKRSRPTRAHPSSPRVCTTCQRTDSPEWRRGPYGPKTLCNACGLKWAKASGAGRRRGAQANAPPPETWAKDGAYPGYSPTAPPPAAYPQYPPTQTGPPIPNDHAPDHHRIPDDPRRDDRRDMISRPGTADAFRNGDVAMRPGDLARTETAPELRPPPTSMGAPSSLGSSVGLSAPIGNVPPPPRSVSGSESADENRVKVEEREREREREVKAESDATSGLMDLANVALEGRRDMDQPAQQGLKRPRADSGYDRLSSSSSSSGPRFVDGARQGPGGYADGGRAYDGPRPYDREFAERRFEGGGSRPIDVIPIGGDKW